MLDKPISEITASDIKTQADWQELCELEYQQQQFEGEPESREAIWDKFAFLRPDDSQLWAELEPTFADLQKQKLSDLNIFFAQACGNATVVMNGVVYDANETANRNVQGLLTLFEAAEDTAPASIQFCAHDNSFHALGLVALKTLQRLIIEKGQQLYQQKWVMRSAIEAAQTKEELASVQIVF